MNTKRDGEARRSRASDDVERVRARGRVVPFLERVQRDKFPLTYEAISPRGADVEPYLAEFRDLPGLDKLAGVNVTNNPSARVRIDPAAFGHLLLEYGVDVLPHVTCRDDTLAGIQRWLFGAWALGMRNVVVMTGDHPKEGDYPEEKRVDSVNAIELVAGIKRFLAHGYLIPDIVAQQAAYRYANRFDPPKPPKTVSPVDFHVGSPLIPWRANELVYAKAKIEAGVDFFQTQITWDETPVVEFLVKAEEQGTLDGRIPVLVGTSPLKTLKTMEFMHNNIPHVRVPPSVQQRLHAAKDPGWESVDVAVEMLARLRDAVRSRGLKTKVGGHVLPINDNRLGAEIVRRAAIEV
ncbi:MAG: methylenetetrahydrofolate reductase [Thermoplasmatota archaeon]